MFFGTTKVNGYEGFESSISSRGIEADVKAFPFYAGLFLVTNATMMLELIQTRILSVTAWYYLAFFVIGLGMFGLTAGAVWVYLKREHYSCESLPFHLARHSMLFSLSTAVSLLVELTLPLTDKFGLGGILAWALLSIMLALPFFFSGIVVSLALTRSPFPIGRVPGVDLAGAAFGCLSVIFVLNHTDGPAAVLWTGASASLAGLLFSNVGINAENSRGSPPALVRWRTAVLVLMAGGAALNEWSQNGLRPLFVKGKTEIGPSRPMFEEWNSFSRVAVFSEPNTKPHLWGPSPKFSPAIWKIEQRIVNIDGSAETRTYRISEGIHQAGFLKSDVTNLAYYLPNQERAAVIGMGGGRDVLSARVFGVPEITGVEINPILVRLLTVEPEHAQYANLQKLQGVRFVIDEARSWLARTDETFDVIQMSLVDTWASTGAGAFTLSENGLYTVEAWRIIIRRLTPRGVFTVSRWYAPGNVNETGRLVSLGMATALDTGAANPRDHLFLAAAGEIATLIYSRSPFSQAQLAHLEAAVSEQGFSILIHPSKQPESSVLKGILASSNR
ncbi:MAG: hypothetical protein O2960_29310, partial [Verrucomicrobia bacterium]|nr:hypothetical protein [Verrucomicrobiota bacterium]